MSLEEVERVGGEGISVWGQDLGKGGKGKKTLHLAGAGEEGKGVKGGRPPHQGTVRLPGEVTGAGPRARVLLQWLILPLVCPVVRQVRLVRGLQAVEAQEQGTATMEVELSHADVEGSWTRDGLRLQLGPNCQLAVHGPTHTLTLSRLQRQDGGLVAFRAEGVHTSAHLVVTGACSRGAALTPECLPLSLRCQGGGWGVVGEGTLS